MGIFKLRKGSLALAVAGLTAAATAGPRTEGKIPTSTSSDDTKQEYLIGRDLTERLQLHNAIEHFDKAITLDPTFATAELGRANVATTAGEFFTHLKKALSLSGGASGGERLVILATEAGVNGDVAKQRELLEELATTFPNDERAHNLLGTFFFGIQDYPNAVEQLKAATDLAHAFAPAYNLLGYSYRSLRNYPDAEKTFAKYIQLVPDDPNPYDSYAELLLKVGKFDSSIENYKLALAKDPNFISAKQGIAFNHLYLGDPREAESELQSLLQTARDDGERRQGLFDLAVLHVDQGNTVGAIHDLESEYAVAEKRHDVPSMTADLDAKGNVLEHVGKLDEAKELYDRELQTIEASDLLADVKEGISLGHLYHATTLALTTKNLNGASVLVSEYIKKAAAKSNPTRIELSYELSGMVALAAADYANAVEELQKANLRNPANI